MEHHIRRHRVVGAFECLGSACPDTCCKSWDMQLDAAHLNLYRDEAPELLGAVMEGTTGPVMRRDAASGYCVKLVEGWCGIHTAYGARFLGDACYFYPRVTRALGETRYMSATLSCPEIARLALFTEHGGFEDAPVERLPTEIRNYAPEALGTEAANAVHAAVLAYVETASDATRALLGLLSVSRSLDNLEIVSWSEAVPFLLRTVEGRIMPAEPNPLDAGRLLLFLVTVVHATGIAVSPRLMQTVSEIATCLGVSVDWERIALQAGAEGPLAHMPEVPDTLLRRWLLTSLAMNQFPFAGHGTKPFERAVLMAVKFCLARLAMSAALVAGKGKAAEEETVRAVQSIARILDHVGDPALMLAIAAEFQWLTEPGINGLVHG